MGGRLSESPVVFASLTCTRARVSFYFAIAKAAGVEILQLQLSCHTIAIDIICTCTHSSRDGAYFGMARTRVFTYQRDRDSAHIPINLHACVYVIYARAFS